MTAYIQKKKSRDEKRNDLIDNKDLLCSHGRLNLLKYTMVKYIPEYLYNDMKKIRRKYWDKKKYWELDTSEDFLLLTNDDIKYNNIRCE